MGGGSSIPSTEFDSTIVGARQCFDAWRETVRPFFDIEPLAGTESGKERARIWLVDKLSFTSVAYSPQSFDHRSVHAKNANHLSFQIYKRGRSRGVHADVPFEMAPGAVHIFDHSRESLSITDSDTGEVAVAGAQIPYEAVGYDPGRHPARVSFPCTSPAGRFLRKAYIAVADELPTLRQDEAPGLAEGFCGMLRSFIVPQPLQDPRQKTLREERRAEMRSYLDRRLADPDIGTEDLCREFGVSRASVYRAFADVGGVARYITNRRLDRAYHQLLSRPPSRGAVKEVGSRWGFVEIGHFSRLFSHRFGMSPSVALSAGPTGTTPDAHEPPAGIGGPGLTIMADWLRGI